MPRDNHGGSIIFNLCQVCNLEAILKNQVKKLLNILNILNEVTQLCPTLCDPMDCSLPGSSVHGIFQAWILDWVAIAFSRRSSRPRDRTQVSRTGGRRFNLWTTREAHQSGDTELVYYYKICPMLRTLYSHTHPLTIPKSWQPLLYSNSVIGFHFEDILILKMESSVLWLFEIGIFHSAWCPWDLSKLFHMSVVCFFSISLDI